jgi:hypothetical protein
MPLNSTEFKKLTVNFGRDLHEIEQNLYFASKGELSESDRADAVEKAKMKLIEYEGMLPKLTVTQKKQVTHKYLETMEEIRETIENLVQENN